MLLLSFSISDQLREMIQVIDSTRRNVLLTPIQPAVELALQWNASVTRLHNLMLMHTIPVSKTDVIAILQKKDIRKEEGMKKHLIAYKDALDYITRTWSLNPKPVEFHNLEAVAEIADVKSFWQLSRLHFEQMKTLLAFIQSRNDHTVIQMGLSFSHFAILAQEYKDIMKLGALVGYIFLYKGWYDLRKLMIYEDGFIHNRDLFHKHIERLQQEGNSSSFLQYFTEELYDQSNKVIQTIKKANEEIIDTSFWTRLTERQQKILSLFDNPSVHITNRTVQSKFHVSQITVSRDLARLASLGLIYSHGKGRSVYYTKL